MNTNKLLKLVEKRGMITMSEINDLKKESVKYKENVLADSDFEGVKLFFKDGEDLLNFLRKFIRKDGTSRIVDCKQVYSLYDIKKINEASCNDFYFLGFVNMGGRYGIDCQPLFYLNGLKFLTYSTKPVILY